MSEPAWVGILFVSTCQFCWTSTVRSPNILLMSRICSACLKTHAVGETELESSVQRDPGDMKIHSILQLIPTTWMKLGNDGLQKTCLRRDFDYVIQKLTSFQRKEERDLYIQERKALVAILSDHARLSSDWYDVQTLKRSRELENLKEERSRAIVQRLTELGYGKEIRNIQSPDTPLEKHSLVRQPRPLTEKVWNNIKPRLIQYLDRMKAHRMARKRQKVVQSRKETAIAILRKYKNSLPLLTVAPSVVDFLELDCVLQVTNQPSKISVDEASFDPIVKQLPEIFTTFQGSVEQRVIEHTFGADSSLSDEEKATQSRLACNAFYCQRCTIWARQLNKRKKKNYPEWVTPLFYPDNMLHRCLHLEFHSSYKPKDPVLVTDGYRVRRAWSTDELVVDEDFRKVIRDVISLVGKDPGETTAQDMDSALEDIQFKCDKCPPMLSEDVLPPTHRFLHFELYGWRTLVQHLFTQHYRETDALESYIQLIESWSEDWEMVDDGTSDSVSPHCVDLPCESDYRTLHEMVEHLMFHHDVQHVEAFVDIFKPMLERPFVGSAARTTELVGIFPEGHPLEIG